MKTYRSMRALFAAAISAAALTAGSFLVGTAVSAVAGGCSPALSLVLSVLLRCAALAVLYPVCVLLFRLLCGRYPSLSQSGTESGKSEETGEDEDKNETEKPNPKESAPNNDSDRLGARPIPYPEDEGKAALSGIPLFLSMLLGFVLILGVSAALSYAFRRLGIPTASSGQVIFPDGMAPAAAVCFAFLGHVLLPALTEEYFYRGAILPGLLSAGCGGRLSVCVSAVLFSAAHSSPAQMLTAFAAGLILGELGRRSRSFLPTAAVHLTYNAVVLFLAVIAY